MNSPEFLRLKVVEDPYNFIDEVKQILGVIQVTSTESVEFEPYQLKDVSHIWFT